jgi:hypothetical protein
MPRELEQVAMPDEVRLNISFRVLDAVADSGLRAEVNDAVKRVRLGQALERNWVGKIHALETKTVAVLALQTIEPCPLERRVIIIVEIVDPDHLVATLQQGVRRGGADEPRSPCDQNSHGRSLGGAVETAKALEPPP